MYDDAYFEAGGEWAGGYWTTGYAESETLLREEAAEMLPWLPATPGSLIEIGCAGGVFLAAARDLGWSVTGVELNSSMAALATSRGLNVQNSPVEHADLEPHSFDVVVAQDVLEHIRDVSAVTARARELLAPGGTLLVRGPLEASAKSWIYERVRKLTDRPRVIEYPPLHIHGFTPRSFRRLVFAQGFQGVRMETKSYCAPLVSFSPTAIAAQVVGRVGQAIDLVSGGGAFMVGAATV
jgi:SAM-dependent methyltransferase